MPIMQDYEAEVTLQVVVKRKLRSGGQALVVDYTVTDKQEADSYTPANSLPAAMTKAVDAVHRQAAAFMRTTKDNETVRLK